MRKLGTIEDDGIKDNILKHTIMIRYENFIEDNGDCFIWNKS